MSSVTKMQEYSIVSPLNISSTLLTYFVCIFKCENHSTELRRWITVQRRLSAAYTINIRAIKFSISGNNNQRRITDKRSQG